MWFHKFLSSSMRLSRNIQSNPAYSSLDSANANNHILLASALTLVRRRQLFVCGKKSSTGTVGSPPRLSDKAVVSASIRINSFLLQDVFVPLDPLKSESRARRIRAQGRSLSVQRECCPSAFLATATATGHINYQFSILTAQTLQSVQHAIKSQYSSDDSSWPWIHGASTLCSCVAPTGP